MAEILTPNSFGTNPQPTAKVLAQVNGKAITEEDVNRFIMAMQSFFRLALSSHIFPRFQRTRRRSARRFCRADTSTSCLSAVSARRGGLTVRSRARLW